MLMHTSQADPDSQTNSPLSLESILQAIGNLQPDDKNTLVNEIVGKEPNISIVLGNNNLAGSVVFQFNIMSSEQATQVLNAVRDRIESEGK